MLKKKCMVGVLLAILGLTTLMMIPIGSSPSTREYDPWLDYNDDGRIDMRDIGSTCMHFGTVGDPAKPVIIAGNNYQIVSHSITITPTTYGNINITTAGFKEITIYFYAFNPASPFSSGEINVVIGFLINRMYGYTDGFTISFGPYLDITVPPLPGRLAKVERTYSVKAPILTIAYYNPNSYNVTLEIEAYLTT